MKPIWAPWRMAYIRLPKHTGCILCDKPGENNDMANLILYRGEQNYVMMNRYPYNPGHIMISPYRHVASLEQLSDAELCDHITVVSRSLKILREALNPSGLNLGMNIGKVAGAGIEDHIHTHIVPRWQGDVNFMPVIGDTRVVSEALAETYEKLKGKF